MALVEQRKVYMKRSNMIQCWRGVAILMIFWAHTRAFLSEKVMIFSDFGEKGVYIFIAISGVLLWQNSQQKDYAGNIRDGFRYAANKIKRLYPLHFFLWSIMFMATTTDANWIRNVIYSIFNLSLTQDFIPFSGIINSFNGPSWYLSMCMFLWILTPPFIKFVECLQLKRKKVLGKFFVESLLAWVIWLNLGTLFLHYVQTEFSKINPDWFERWLLYSCPVLDFIIYLCAFWGFGYFSQCREKHTEYILLAVLVIAVSVLTKGKIPILHNIPFVIAVIYLITYTVNFELYIRINPLFKLLVFYGNISSYFFLIHGVVNMLINRTVLVNMRPWVFLISFVFSTAVSYCLYCWTKHRKNVKLLN